MSIHFLSNHPVDFEKLGGTVNTSPPAAFNPAYVPQCLQCTSSAPNWRQAIPPAVTDNFYWQARVLLNVMSASGGLPLVQFYSGTAGALSPKFQLYYPNFGNIRLRWNNLGTWTDIGGDVALGTGILYALTVLFKFDGTQGQLSFWVNNTLIGSVTGNTLAYNAAGNITYVELFNSSGGSGAFGDHYWAEFVVTKNEHPFLMRVKTHILQANSAVNTGWTGSYTDVDEADPSATDILSTSTPGHVRTFTIDPLPALGALVVRAVQVSAMARRGITGPQGLQHTLRASGVNQNSPTKTLQTGFNPTYHVYEQNSVTGQEFTKAEIDASEPGVTAVA